MTYNEMLRTLRYALNMSDAAMMDIFYLSGHALGPFDLAGLLKRKMKEVIVFAAMLFWDGF